MGDTSIDKIYKCIEALKINAYAGDLAGFLDAENMSPEEIHAISRMLEHLCQQKEETRGGCGQKSGLL